MVRALTMQSSLPGEAQRGKSYNNKSMHELMQHLELEALLTVEEQSSLPGEAHCGITYATFAMIEMNTLDNW